MDETTADILARMTTFAEDELRFREDAGDACYQCAGENSIACSACHGSGKNAYVPAAAQNLADIQEIRERTQHRLQGRVIPERLPQGGGE